jgi:hypothetical protein
VDIKIRIWAVNDEFPEGKMYYPDTTHGEVDENRGFFFNQSMDVLYGKLRNQNVNKWSLEWARIDYDNVTKMLGSGIKDTDGKEIYVGDIISFKRRSTPRKLSYGWTDKIGAVSFDEGCFAVDGFLMKDLQGDIYIKGNIFENPELVGLEKENVE